MLAKSKSSFLQYGLLLFQLSLLFVIIYKFNLEKDTQLYKILPVTLIGFAIHYWLPNNWKRPFFLVISGTAIIVILGPILGICLIGVGLLLISICHLPFRFWARVLLLILVVTCCILVRMQVFENSNLSLLIPFVGTMFLLRLILYVYDLRYDDTKNSLWARISYFFLLPNVCFPLFPLIDFKIFERTYYNTDVKEVHAIALRRIFRGVVHLLTYKFLYFFIVPDTSEISTLYDFLQFFIFSYTLIVRLSGMFHISLGILGLFGFNLPPIFKNYFFASSFSDIWRRVNIYWREALMKLVYYPIYFLVKNKYKTMAISISIVVVFICNWFLHGYQMFWIIGEFPVTPNDILFWTVFGISVLLNSLLIQKFPKQPEKGSTLNSEIIKVLKTIGMFLFMCFMWLLWSSSSVTEWLYLLSFFKTGTSIQWLKVLIGLSLFITLCIVLHISYKRGFLKIIIRYYTTNITVINTICMIVFFLISFQQFFPNFKLNGVSVIPYLQENMLSTKDKKEMERGYYQTLLNKDQMAMQLWGNQFAQPQTWFTDNKALQRINNVPYRILLPNKSVSFKGKTLTTNRWGMRDKEYSLVKPQTVNRFLLLGGSYEMGSGVEDFETFESVLENKINKEENRVEILNLAVGGYHLIENVHIAQTSLSKYNADAIIYTAHTEEFERIIGKVTQLIERNSKIEDPELLSIIEASGATSKMCRLEIENRLKKSKRSIISWGYQSIYNSAARFGATPYWVFLPAVGDEINLEEQTEIRELAAQIGFYCIVLNDVYGSYSIEELVIAPWDTHPNKLGHALIAEELYEKLKQQISN